MGKQYENPPTVEVVCEFRFEESIPWDFVFPGLLYKKLEDTFPERKLLKDSNIRVDEKSGGTKQIFFTDRMQFLHKDKIAFIQVSPDILTINHFRPYQSWKKFLKLITKAFKAYIDVVKPKSIQRIGLRYVNVIKIKEKNFKSEDYFKIYPFIHKDLPQDFGLFNLRLHLPYENQTELLKVELSDDYPSRDQEGSEFNILLDLDYHLNEPQKVPLGFEELQKWLEIAHNRIEEIFESSLTEKTKKLFGKVK